MVDPSWMVRDFGADFCSPNKCCCRCPNDAMRCCTIIRHKGEEFLMPNPMVDTIQAALRAFPSLREKTVLPPSWLETNNTFTIFDSMNVAKLFELESDELGSIV